MKIVVDDALKSQFSCVLYDGTRWLRYVSDEEGKSEMKLWIWSAWVEVACF